MPSELSANSADKYYLYQKAVQSADQDAAFLNDTYRQLKGRGARHFREDFSGTCLLSTEWVRLNEQHTAECYDIDIEPLKWGYKHNIAPLGAASQRVHQVHADARSPSVVKPDIRCAQNFSYWVFKTRPEMLEYFTGALADLADDGVFVIDLHGGPESQQELVEETEIEEPKFTYVWDQDSLNPITSEATLHIHFKFTDGSEMRDAFTYSWRLWGLTELKELLEDAGFSTVTCYWEGTAEDGESGNGIFTPSTEGEACLSYVAYLVAQK